ncbi:fatty acid-binding protein DegV [Mangrovactinospora gilvigrisea]|uniref:Fatty acid-binding protein DegV n=1 Tax=Mangrovactinospora gilvigrisea TaxID=1428644 RepID=A0A1J7B9R5_9ACTN|nr:DegV family protein [Mangrovactinospora gilvigrisea]OIV35395.1 fatty acid-binding protein DegV [Mangrovactinospora gilvigrisea]
MSRVAIVTDSTAYLPEELLERHRIGVVPLSVVMSGEAYDEGTQVEPRAVAYALQRRREVTTSRPAPEAFAAAYRAAAEEGADEVVSLHLSAELSSTHESAWLAAESAPLPVRVVDTRMVAMALGFAVLEAAEAAERGADGEKVVAAALGRAERSSGLFYVDTLEYLRRGGRIGAAQALLGSALSVKPLLHLEGGRIQPLEKVRTSSKAVARLEELAVERAGDGPVDVTVHHLAAVERAEPLAERLRERLPGLRRLFVTEVGAVIGAHVGPGLLAVVVAPV